MKHNRTSLGVKKIPRHFLPLCMQHIYTRIILVRSTDSYLIRVLITDLTAYVILSGRSARIMHSLCSEVLFFHSWGNFSFSGHPDSTSVFQRFADPSMSRSKLRNSSIVQSAWDKTSHLIRGPKNPQRVQRQLFMKLI